MANISDKLTKILSAIFGKDVRQALHDGLEAVNNETENTTTKQTQLESQFKGLIINAGSSNAENVAARTKADGTTFDTIGKRMDDSDSKLDKKVHYFNTINDIKTSHIGAGKYISTLGYFLPNDGGGANYYTVDDSTLIDDGGGVIAIGGNIKAKLIPNNNINVKQFGAKGDGINDDSTSIQNAIIYASNLSTSDKWENGNLCKEVIIPSGKYICENINLRSGLLLKGESLSTWLISKGSDYIIKTTSYTNETRHHGLGIENICLSKSELKDSVHKVGENGKGIYLASGNGQEYLKSIFIYGLETGLCLENEFDTYMEHIELKSNGKNIVMLTNDVEVTNAININGLRSENAIISELEIIDKSTIKKQVRSIQFSNCKFEGGKGIFIAGARDIKFINTNFVKGVQDTEDSSTDNYWIKFANYYDKNLTQIGQTDGIIFSNCSFMTAGGRMLLMKSYDASFPVMISNCVFFYVATMGVVGNIKITHSYLQECMEHSFNIPYPNNVEKIDIDPTKCPIQHYEFSDPDWYSSALLNKSDNSLIKGGHSTEYKLNTSYKNTSAKTARVTLMIHSQGDFEVINNGSSYGVIRKNSSVTGFIYNMYTFFVNPNEEIRLSGSETDTIIEKIILEFI